MPYEASVTDWIAFHLLPGFGPPWKYQALARCADPGEIAHRWPPREFVALPRFRRKALPEILEARRGLGRRAEKELRRCERMGVRVVPLRDPGYPAVLGTLPDPPILLYVKGELPEAVTRIAIVGSRRPTHYGKRVALGMAGGLAARGAEIVSGGARGIDTCAHRGALEEDGRTVAVLGSGFRRPYPAENAALFDRIAASGAVMSEFPLDVPPVAENFPRRNRLISGLSAAVVVVEAALRSGSLITAGQALEQGREVLAVPGPVSSTRSQGCHALIQDGAKLVQNVEDILAELSPMYRMALGSGSQGAGKEPGAPEFEQLGHDEIKIVTILDDSEPVHLDELADRVPLSMGRLQTALFGLELRGTVEQLAGGYYLLRPRRES